MPKAIYFGQATLTVSHLDSQEHAYNLGVIINIWSDMRGFKLEFNFERGSVS